MDTTAYFVDKYNLDLSRPSPIEIPDVGRDSLGLWFKELGLTRGVELGVEKGVFSKVLLTANPELELYCVDSWQPYLDYRCWMNTETSTRNYMEARARLKRFPNVRFIKAFSKIAVNKFEDNSLDFVYIDANHDLPWVMNDIIWWEKKVRPGGIVAGHDYIRVHPLKPSRCFVIEAVAWYTELKPVNPWFLIGTRAKVAGEVRDHTRSFFWIKP
jgi:predicted O-methyltransferase YrrM